MPALTSKLIVELVDRVSGPAKAAANSVGALNGRLRGAVAAQAASARRLQGQMVGAIAAGYSLQRALAAPIKAAADFQSAMLDIGQKADLGDSAIKALGDRIRAMAPLLNQTSSEVAKGMDTLVGFGLDPERAEALLKPIGRAATAYKASVDDLARAGFAALDNLKLKAEDFARALDVMSQSGKEGAFEIADMAREFPSLTAAAQGLGMSGVTAIGRLSAALQIARKGAASGSEAAINTANLMQKIISPETTKKFKKLHVDIRNELKKTQKAGGDVFEMIAIATNKALGGDLSKLGDLFEDAQVQKFLRPLIQNLEEYRRIRDKSLGANGVVDKDFERRMETAEARMAAFGVRMRELAISIGNALLPAMNDLMATLAPLARMFEKFADAHPQLVGGAIKVAAALVATRVAAIAARYALVFLKGAVLGLAVPAVAAAAGLVSLGRAIAIAAVIRPAVAALAGLRAALIGVVAVTAIGGIRVGLAALAAGAVSLLNPLRLLPALLGGVSVAMRGVGLAMLTIPGAAVLLAIGAAGTFIYNNWKGLGTFFSSFFASLKASLSGIGGDRFKVLTDALDGLAQVWQRWTGEISNEAWADAGASAGNSVASAIMSIADAIDTVLQKWEALKNFFSFDIGSAVSGALSSLGFGPKPYTPGKGERPGHGPAAAPAPQVQPIFPPSPASARTRPEAAGPMPASGVPLPRSRPTADGGYDVGKSAAQAVQHLDMSAQAGSAGEKSAAAFKERMKNELDEVDAMIRAKVQSWVGMLSFSASPTITPRVGAAPASAGGGQKAASLDGVSARQQAAFADYGFNTV